MLDGCVQAKKHAWETWGMKIGFLITLVRHLPLEIAVKEIKDCMPYKEHFVGIALAGV